MFCSNLDTHVTRRAKSELPCRMLCSHDTLRKPRKSGPARALDPCPSPQGSWALGTRHNCLRVRLEFSAHAQKIGPGQIEEGVILGADQKDRGLWRREW